MFGSGNMREPRKSESHFRQMFMMIPNLTVELWKGSELAGEAMDTIIKIRKELNNIEIALLEENPNLARTVKKECLERVQIL